MSGRNTYWYIHIYSTCHNKILYALFHNRKNVIIFNQGKEDTNEGSEESGEHDLDETTEGNYDNV